ARGAGIPPAVIRGGAGSPPASPRILSRAGRGIIEEFKRLRLLRLQISMRFLQSTIGEVTLTTWRWRSPAPGGERKTRTPSQDKARRALIHCSDAPEGETRMSAGMEVYLVDEATVKAAPGFNDAELLADLLAQEGQGESLAWLDEELDIEYRYPGFTHA